MQSYLKCILLYLLKKKHAKTNLKFFQYEFSTSVKKWEKQLARKACFNTLLRFSWSNFPLKLWERLTFTKISKNSQVWRSVCVAGGKGEGWMESSKQKVVFGDNHSNNLWDKLYLSCEVMVYENGLNCYFWEVFGWH